MLLATKKKSTIRELRDLELLEVFLITEIIVKNKNLQTMKKFPVTLINTFPPT